MYNQWFDWVIDHLLYPKLKDFRVVHLYLRCLPNVAYERQQSRQRQEEDGITLEYLTQIHEQHEKWLLSPHTKDVVVVDVSTISVSQIATNTLRELDHKLPEAKASPLSDNA